MPGNQAGIKKGITIMQGYTYQPDYRMNDQGYFGAVNIIIGTKEVNSRILHIRRADKEQALQDASKLARRMVTFGIACPINVNDYI